MAIRATFDSTISRVTTPVGHGLARMGLTPNTLTTLGLVLTAVGAGFVVVDRPVVGGLVLIVGGLMDTFDGAVARATSSSTPFGGFYDSVVDRMSDGIILAAMAFWLRDMPRLLGLALVSLVAAQVISYVRARAESIDLDCSIGIMERAERAILLMAGLVLYRWILEPVLWVLAVGGIVTVVQRIHHVWCQVARDVPEELVALAVGRNAWNRAFLVAARRFYGSKNFDAAYDDVVREPRPVPGDR